MAAAAVAGEVLVTGTVCDLVVGAGIAFEDAGERELKGIPESWRLYRMVDSPIEDGSAREPTPPNATLLVHELPPLSQRAMIAAARRAPGLSRWLGRGLIALPNAAATRSLIALRCPCRRPRRIAAGGRRAV